MNIETAFRLKKKLREMQDIFDSGRERDAFDDAVESKLAELNDALKDVLMVLFYNREFPEDAP